LVPINARTRQETREEEQHRGTGITEGDPTATVLRRGVGFGKSIERLFGKVVGELVSVCKRSALCMP
jgi:hypothetical protein